MSCGSDFLRSLLDRVLDQAAAALKMDITGSLRCKIQVSLPPDSAQGQVATNAAFLLARPLKTSPKEAADRLQPFFLQEAQVSGAQIAGAGFLNLTLTDDFWSGVLHRVLRQGKNFGRSDAGQGKRVNIEYVSANPTGPLHVAHGRGAIVGDVLANVLDATGFDVTREYYINDAGQQIETLVRSAIVRYEEAVTGQQKALPEGGYPGGYLKELAAKLYEEEQKKGTQKKTPAELQDFLRARVPAALLQDIQGTLKDLGVQHDVFTSEADLIQKGCVAKTLEVLDQKGLLYKGTLPPPKGKEDAEWTPQTMTLFRAKKFGQPQDVPVKKADGAMTYFGNDVAYHAHKLGRGFDRLINIWGADHGSQVGRLQAAVQALGSDPESLQVVLCQMVRVMHDGQPLKMSKRAGTFVTLDQVLKAVGRDALRFMLVSQAPTTHLTLDVADMLKTSQDNPVFYVQYAYARGASVLRAAQDLWPNDSADPNALHPLSLKIDQLGHQAKLLHKLAFWPACLQGAAQHSEPHRVTLYLTEVARLFHGVWSQGNSNHTLRFLHKDSQEKSAPALALIRAMLYVLQQGLDIVGVQPKEELFDA